MLIRLILIFSVLALVFKTSVGYCQGKILHQEYTFMFCNTENFYDSENDPLTNDDEFTPQGNRGWTSYRYHTKAERLGKVIVAAGKWNPPVFVGLCETENLDVLKLLTGIAPLEKYHYKIVQKDSPDERGIDVAFIYRPDLFSPFDYETIPINDPNDKTFKTRDILRVTGVLNGCDTLHIFVNHWPSRYGGIMETINYRSLAASMLKKSVLALQQKFGKAKIICIGDFNDTPKDESVAKVLEAREEDSPDLDGELINLSYQWISQPVQTIKSQYTWEVFDQVIVSDFFLKENNCYQFQKTEIFNPAFLLEPDQKFGGVKPKRTYIGMKYQEGFSDHLPVLVKITAKNP